MKPGPQNAPPPTCHGRQGTAQLFLLLAFLVIVKVGKPFGSISGQPLPGMRGILDIQLDFTLFIKRLGFQIPHQDAVRIERALSLRGIVHIAQAQVVHFSAISLFRDRDDPRHPLVRPDMLANAQVARHYRPLCRDHRVGTRQQHFLLLIRADLIHGKGLDPLRGAQHLARFARAGLHRVAVIGGNGFDQLALPTGELYMRARRDAAVFKIQLRHDENASTGRAVAGKGKTAAGVGAGAGQLHISREEEIQQLPRAGMQTISRRGQRKLRQRPLQLRVAIDTPLTIHRRVLRKHAGAAVDRILHLRRPGTRDRRRNIRDVADVSGRRDDEVRGALSAIVVVVAALRRAALETYRDGRQRWQPAGVRASLLLGGANARRGIMRLAVVRPRHATDIRRLHQG